MAIQPLQLPPIINLPTPDFSVLGSIGQDLYQAKARAQAPGLLADAFGPQQTQPNQPLPQPQQTGTPLNALGNGATDGGIGSDYAADYSARARSAESGGNLSAHNPNSSASGLYQFTDGTWLSSFDKTFPQYAGLSPQQKLAYKTDATPQGQAVQNAVFKTFTGDNAKSLSSAGLPVNNATLYAAHFFGAGDAPKVLTANPSAPLASVVQPQTIAANPFLANMTVGQAQQWLASKMGGSSPQQTPQQPPQAGPGGGQPQQAMPGLTPDMAQRIGAMLTNPYTAQLGQALLQKYAAPSYGFQTLPNGTVLRTDTLHGTVAPVYQAQTPYGFQTLPDGTIVRTNSAQGTVQPIFQGAGKPVTAKPGEHILVPDGNGGFRDVYGNGAGMFDDKTLTAMADQYIAGDKSVFQNLGRGSQAAENIVALRQKVQERMAEKGISPEQQAVKMAEYNGMIQTQKTLGSRIANIEMAVTEAQQLAPQVLETSAAVDRTRFPAINKILLAGEKGVGDPAVVKLGIALNSFINVYSRAINPGGAPTVNDKEHARELLSDAWSSGQLQAGMGQLMKEMDLARKSPDIVRKSIREQYSGNGEQSQAAPQQKVGSYADVSQSLSNAKAAIVQGAPREAVIKRLIDSGVPPAMANRL